MKKSQLGSDFEAKKLRVPGRAEGKGPFAGSRTDEQIDVIWSIFGQIIATSHDLTPNGGFSTGNPLISGKPRLMKYYDLARYYDIHHKVISSYGKRLHSSKSFGCQDAKFVNLGVSKNRDTPKWMVYNGKPY